MQRLIRKAGVTWGSLEKAAQGLSQQQVTVFNAALWKSVEPAWSRMCHSMLSHPSAPAAVQNLPGEEGQNVI